MYAILTVWACAAKEMSAAAAVSAAAPMMR